MAAEKTGVTWGHISIILFVTIAAPILFVVYMKFVTPEGMLGVLLVISVIALIITLTFSAFVFKALGLSDPNQSLGLPEGSMQAVIALSLILIFMLSSLVLYDEVATPSNLLPESTLITQNQINELPNNTIVYIQRTDYTDKATHEVLFNVGTALPKTQASQDIAKQIITVVSTLVVAVAGFYFGSKSATAVSGGVAAISAPLIRSINPTGGKREEDIGFKIFGKNFELAKEVKLIRDSIEIQCTDVTSSSTMITGKLKIPKDSEAYPGGKWTVVVINSDKGEDRLESAFTVNEI
jgi:hypothetical protein